MKNDNQGVIAIVKILNCYELVGGMHPTIQEHGHNLGHDAMLRQPFGILKTIALSASLGLTCLPFQCSCRSTITSPLPVAFCRWRQVPQVGRIDGGMAAGIIITIVGLYSLAYSLELSSPSDGRLTGNYDTNHHHHHWPHDLLHTKRSQVLL